MIAALIIKAKKKTLMYTEPLATVLDLSELVAIAPIAKTTAPAAVNHIIPTTVKRKKVAL